MKNNEKKDSIISDPFEDYQLEADPDKRERSYAWHTAIGLQAVDGLETSKVRSRSPKPKH